MLACRYKKNSPRGFTIVEMLVAMAIAGIFLSIFIGVVMATFQTLRTGDERTSAQQNARIAMRFIVRDIKQAIEISPRRLEEPYDPATGDLPRDENSYSPFDDTEYSYPIFRRSTDADDFGTDSPGFIDLSHDGDGWDGDEYGQFRPDGYPYDIRPLAPNRLELMLNTDYFYSHTQYFGDDPETPDTPPLLPDPIEVNVDITPPGGPADNPQSLRTRVTYEHQIVPPKIQIYNTSFDGNEKDFEFFVNRQGSLGVDVDEEFCIVRSYETEFLDNVRNFDVIRPSEVDPDLYVDAYAFRQPLADHIIDVRFRYWHVELDNGSRLWFDNNFTNPDYPYNGYNNMIEIRYDPDINNAHDDPNGGAGTPINTDDGYYRYFTPWGQEIYVWWNYDAGEMVEFVDESLPYPDKFGPVQNNSFYVYQDPDPDWEEYQRGILLFEGWRFINMISVTIRATNRSTLDKFKQSVDVRIIDPTLDDWRMGFIDFGRDIDAPNGLWDMDNKNVYDPLYRGVDNYRSNAVTIGGNTAWDFVEPNINRLYDPNSFVTLEMFVIPPAMRTISEESELLLTYGFNHKGSHDPI
jgi:prepilin-type N-terminal cleavage/methylation domain-containing protein